MHFLREHLSALSLQVATKIETLEHHALTSPNSNENMSCQLFTLIITHDIVHQIYQKSLLTDFFFHFPSFCFWQC